MSVICKRSVVFSTNKTDRHDITEILLKVALNTIILTLFPYIEDGLAQNRDNVPEWSDMSTYRLLFQWVRTTKIEPKADIIISAKCNLFSPWYRWKIANFALKQQSLTHYIMLWIVLDMGLYDQVDLFWTKG